MTGADGVDATFSATAIMELPRRLRHRRRGHREQPGQAPVRAAPWRWPGR